MHANAIQDGWRRFLRRLKQLWGPPIGNELPATQTTLEAPVTGLSSLRPPPPYAAQSSPQSE